MPPNVMLINRMIELHKCKQYICRYYLINPHLIDFSPLRLAKFKWRQHNKILKLCRRRMCHMLIKRKHPESLLDKLGAMKFNHKYVENNFYGHPLDMGRTFGGIFLRENFKIMRCRLVRKLCIL